MTKIPSRQTGLRCGRCLDEIYSNSRHDFNSCMCGAWFVDGGFDYSRTGGLPYIPVTSVFRDASLIEDPHFSKEKSRRWKRKWTRDRCVKWNQKHWDLVGDAVTERLQWWETVRTSPWYGEGNREIDV